MQHYNKDFLPDSLSGTYSRNFQLSVVFLYLKQCLFFVLNANAKFEFNVCRLWSKEQSAKLNHKLNK